MRAVSAANTLSGGRTLRLADAESRRSGFMTQRRREPHGSFVAVYRRFIARSQGGMRLQPGSTGGRTIRAAWLALVGLRQLPGQLAGRTDAVDAKTRQLDRLGESEPSLPGLDDPTAIASRRSGQVGADLNRDLAPTRAAQTLPLARAPNAHRLNVVPQMKNWLPDEEGAQLRFQFEAEIRRLEAA